jgi:hypothetical protein
MTTSKGHKMNVHQVEALLLTSKKRTELPLVKSVNFTKIVSVMDKKIKISLFLKAKKVQDYIEQLATEENLTITDYYCLVGIGRNAKTLIDARVALYLVAELSVRFKYHLINNLVMTHEDIVLECERVPKTALSKRYKLA